MRAVVVVAAMGLVGACSSSPSGESTTTSPAAAPTTTTTAGTTTTTLEAIPVWVQAQVENPDPQFGMMNAAVEFDGRLVAAGQSGYGAEVWVSSDGLVWTRVEQADLAIQGSAINDLAIAGPGLVAAGEARGEDGFGPAVWTSTDGLDWTRVSPDPATFEGPRHGGISALTVSRDLLVAVGYETKSSHAAIWTSVDGVKWARIPNDDDLFGDASKASYRTIDDVVAFDSGFVAVGMAQDGDSTRAAVWLSADGMSWSRFDASPEGAVTGHQAMRSIAVANGSLIAVGVDWQAGTAAAWSSDDGIEWMRVRDADFGGPGTFDLGYSEMRAVLAAAGGLVAVGSIQEAGSSDGAVWRSTDGISWSRDESAALGGRWYQDLFAAAEFAGGIAVVGTDSVESEGPFAAAWYIGPSTATVPTTTTTFAPLPTIVTPGAPDFVMRCGDIVRPYESPPPITYPNCAWVAWADPLWSVGRWELDPDNPPDPASSSLTVLAWETGCIGRSPPDGLEIRPIIMISGDEIVVFVLIEARVYPANCSGPNPKFPVTIDLGAPLGNRRVFEGKLVPPILRFPEA